MIYIEKRDVYKYPSKSDFFSPSVLYPEYLWGQDSISKIENPIYDMVRQVFVGMKMDLEHYGTAEWNPLGEIIQLGDTVLLKPNMVMHQNHVKSFGTDCLITHPSIVRAVLDYVLIALKGTGKIIVGDAPLQTCDFETLVEEQGYNAIQQFYKQRNVEFTLADFRLVKSKTVWGQVKTIYYDETNRGCHPVNLGAYSAHCEKNAVSKRYRVTKYDPAHMQSHHNEERHEYLISNYILQADVIINLPKPKTHRKAGMTGALKNLIGINGNKDWLPHHTKGSVEEGGDEYYHKNCFKQIAGNIDEIMIKKSQKDKTLSVQCMRFLRKGSSFLSKVIAKDPFYEGSWYGNDTIWRTIVDLNRILLYADKQGQITEGKQQRRLLILGDMVISGEGEGPLIPEEKPIGIIAGSKDPVIFDTVAATLMGFDFKKIPSIRNAYFIKCLKLTVCDFQFEIYSNKNEWNKIAIKDLQTMNPFRFKASKGWMNHIEL